MKRNNKGFTLIELLAAVVILGILIAVSIPLITGLFDNSKKKMYINDAKKLISLAEYKMQASSSTINRPDEGDCILISMLYLDSSDFDNPPGKGEYLKESSYVVVRNNGGKLDYAATVVERVKGGGYVGVELTKNSDLIASNAIKHVLSSDKIDVLDVESDVNRGYVNEKLGYNYISVDNGITAIYNKPEVQDNSATADSSKVPKIVYASMISSTNKYFNTLEATLQIRVEDKDTPKSGLTVYVNVGTGYSTSVTARPYGNQDTFTCDIDFTRYGMTYNGDNIKVYIVVKDTDGNNTKKTINYLIHKNESPHIDESSGVTRRSQDIYFSEEKNMLSAKVTLIVSDDLDNNADLEVCMIQSKGDRDFDISECNSFKKYYSLFNNQGVLKQDYEFTDCGGQTCLRDGSVHYLTVFIKDTQGAITKAKYRYELSKNQKPQIKSLQLESKGKACNRGSCPVEQGGSKELAITINVTDDVDTEYKNMRLCIKDNHINQVKCVTLAKNSTTLYPKLDGLYDGQTRKLDIYVVDSEGFVSNTITRNYKLYLNKAPVIADGGFSIRSKNPACIQTENCPEATAGGNRSVYVTLNAEDDIDSTGLNICFITVDKQALDAGTVSVPTKNNCNTYYSYSNFYNKEGVYLMPSQVYDGSTKIVYVFVVDSEGLYDSDNSSPYRLYRNQNPSIKYATFKSDSSTKPLTGNLNTIFEINATDDVDTASALKLQIIEDGVVRVNNEKLSNWINKENKYRLYGAHDGQTRNIVVKILDGDGGVDTLSTTYDVYEGKPPTIYTDEFRVYSSGLPCINNSFCTSGNVNNRKAAVKVKVSDDIDENKDIKICLSESSSDCISSSEYSAYTNYLNGTTPKEVYYSFNAGSTKPYDGSTKTLYLNVMDSDGNKVTASKTYKLYKNVAPRITKNPVVISNADDPNVHIANVTYSIGAEDDLDSQLQIQYCYRKDGGAETCPKGYEDYVEDKVLDKSFFNTSHPNGETYVIYSKIKDKYGEVTVSDEKTYKLYVDAEPSIYLANAVYGTRIYKNSAGDVVESLDEVNNPSSYSAYTRLKLYFSVDDQYDTFSICVNNNSSSCNNYAGVFAGNNCTTSACGNRVRRNVDYDIPVDMIQNGSNPNLYFFAKDSYNSVVSAALYNETYEECSENNDSVANYEYEFNSTKTQSTYGHSDPISIDRCAGQCYQQNNIFAIYTTSITYNDRFNSTVVCNSDNPVIEYQSKSCDFKDCFYKNNNYTRNAIGTRLYNDAQWTFVNNGTSYVCTGHYNLYQSKVVKGNINLTKVGTVCNTAVTNGVYNYNSSSSNPYVRVDDINTSW